MARIVDWLKTNPGKEEPGRQVLSRRSRTHARPQPRPTPVDFAADVSGKIIDGGPGKNVLIRNKYVREDTSTHETLEILDDAILEGDEEEAGADPYNTCRYDRSRP